MRFLSFLLAFLSLFGSTAFSPADEQPSKDQPKNGKKVSSAEINRLVDQLGSEDFAKREQARKQLEAIGEPALEILKKAAASSSDAEIRRTAREIVEALELKASGLLHVFGPHGNRVNGVAIRADGKRAVSASWDGKLRYWDLEKSELIREMQGHQSIYINSVTLSADGKQALSGSGDRTMRLWDLESGKELRVFGKHPGPVYDTAFSPDGKKALSGCVDGIARLWDLASGKELFTLPTQEGGCAWTVAFTPDGKQAVTGAGNALLPKGGIKASLLLWDVATGRSQRAARPQRHQIVGIDKVVNGRQLAALQGEQKQAFDGGLLLARRDAGAAMQLPERGHLRTRTHRRGTGESAAYLLNFPVDLRSQLRRGRGDAKIAEDDGPSSQPQLKAPRGDKKRHERSSLPTGKGAFFQKTRSVCG